MTGMRRLLAVTAFLGLAVILSSATQGQPGKKSGTGTTPQLTPSREVSLLAESGDSRFTQPGVQVYQPVKGDPYFALQVQPKLAAQPARPRDILIMLSTAATQSGPGFIAGHQIADGIIETARDDDRIAVMTVSEPKFTDDITNGFLLAKDDVEGKRLRFAMTKYRGNRYPAGDTDLKNALEKALAAFGPATKDRQRIILFCGDGLSTHNPVTEADRLKIANDMVKKQVAFFPVPLGVQLNPTMLHGLANATGGVVLRTRFEEEKLPAALKRFEEALAGAVLYKPEIQLPAGLADVCPAKLPPLRSDTPTLVVGRMKAASAKVDYTLTGTVAGTKAQVSVKASEVVLANNLDNYFLVSMVDQWAKAKDYPAVLRADRALAFAYEQTRLQHQEYLDSAQMALEEGKFDFAGRVFAQARQLSPHDGQAEA
jgi:hypothetical protein